MDNTYELLSALLGQGAYGEDADPVEEAWFARKKRYEESARQNRENPHPMVAEARRKGSWGVLSEPPNLYNEQTSAPLASYRRSRMDRDQQLAMMMERMQLAAETERYKADKMGDWRSSMVDTKREGIDAANQRSQMRFLGPILSRMMMGGQGGGGMKLPGEVAGQLYPDLKRLHGGDPRRAMAEYQQYSQGGQRQQMGPDELMAMIQALSSVMPGWGGQ